MKKIAVVYSPVCEATAAFIDTLQAWLKDTQTEINVYAYDKAPKEYIDAMSKDEDCFIEVFYEGKRIDSVPLHKERIFAALNLPVQKTKDSKAQEISSDPIYSAEEIRRKLFDGNIEFIPIRKENFLDEMTMCLKHYPMGNPPREFHDHCITMKSKIYDEAFLKESAAGIYAKMDGAVAGLLEVFPREILKQYGYMTGDDHEDNNVLTIGCYEVAYGIPRTFMIDELMYHLLQNKELFHRSFLEGIGITGWNEGFRPYWVYEKYGFTKKAKKDENTFVFGLEF